jgi:hypothetical protein
MMQMDTKKSQSLESDPSLRQATAQGQLTRIGGTFQSGPQTATSRVCCQMLLSARALISLCPKFAKTFANITPDMLQRLE